MSKIVNLKATARGQGGKGASRAVRREGRVPAVVYGDKKDPQLVSLAYNELQPHVQSGRFLSTLIDLVIAYTFTRPAVLLLARTKWMARRKVMGIEAVSAAAGGVA